MSVAPENDPHEILLEFDADPGPAGDDWPGDAEIHRLARDLLGRLVAGEKLPGRWQLSLTVMDDAGIRAINRQWRDKDSATDVLSFPQFAFYNGRLDPDEILTTGPDSAGSERNLLGDVVISHETCRRQAREVGHGFGDEFFRLLVHGLLHLVGYDHERSAEEERLMQRREDELLAGLPRYS